MRGRKCHERTKPYSKFLTERRLSLGYSQRQVAKLTGATFRHIQRIESGETPFNAIGFAQGLAVCTLLEIDPYEIVQMDGSITDGPDESSSCRLLIDGKCPYKRDACVCANENARQE